MKISEKIQTRKHRKIFILFCFLLGIGVFDLSGQCSISYSPGDISFTYIGETQSITIQTNCTYKVILPSFLQSSMSGNSLNIMLLNDYILSGMPTITKIALVEQNSGFLLALIDVQLSIALPTNEFSNQNYILTRTYIKTGVEFIDEIQYYDGLGRPIQTVQKGITPQHSDLVTLIEYDGAGREQYQWLPKTNSGNGAFVEPAAFKSKFESLYSGDSRPFTETVYEPSPLNRVTEQFGAGQAWKTANKRIKAGHDANAGDVKYFYVSASGQLVQGSNYGAGSLYKTTSADEDGKTSAEYSDKLGRVVMQRRGTNVDTYYVYNDLGQLSFVLPPLAADGNGTEDAVNKYGYVYKYDERGNCIYKKLPGCDYVRMAYDKANRLIVYQDGNMRKHNKSLVTRYDVFGRVIYTHTTLGYPMEPFLNSLKKRVFTDEYTGTGDFGYTVNSNGITAGIQKLLTVNYYDNYDFLTDDSLKYIPKTGYSKAYTGKADVADPAHADLNAKGLLTGTRTYRLDESVNEYTTEAYYYDNKGNLVQQRSTNHLGGCDFVYNDLDFNGKPNKTLKTHTSTGSPPGYEFGQWDAVNLSELYTYYYDHAGRLVKTTHSINNKPAVILSDLTDGGYDDLGRVRLKKRQNGADTESFEYNIRNQPTKIRSGAFVQNLNYTSNPLRGGTGCYNGSLAHIDWTYGNIVNNYSYTYDELNRIEEAVFEDLDLKVDKTEMFLYDKQGNIKHITRLRDQQYMDMLIIDHNGNQLKKVTDLDGDQGLYDVEEYRDLADKDVEFYYDANGNLTADLDRDIVTIKYNLLNLPEVVQFKNGNQIWNYYDASGRKLGTTSTVFETQIVVPVGSVIGASDWNPCNNYYFGNEYAGSIEYAFENDCDFKTKRVSRVFNPEGYVANATANPGYCYYRRDHLGSIREVWAGSTIQRTQYYASGLPWADGFGQDTQQQKYNGKEWMETHGLDEYYSYARNFYPALMRTNTMDPLAEKYYHISPYAWCGNDPVNNIDPDGMDYWTTSDPDQIRAFLNAYQSGSVSTNTYSSWTHISDEALLKFQGNGRLTYNDRIRTFYSSTSGVENGIFTVTSRSWHVNTLPAVAQDPDSNWGVDGTYNIWNRNEIDAAMNFYWSIAAGELVGAGLAAVRGMGWLTSLANGGKISNRAFFSGAGTEAKAIQEGFLTLSQTRAGQNLMKLTEGMSYYGPNNGQPASQAWLWWARLSSTYAKGIPQGNKVNVFLNNPSSTGIWNMIEKPILQQRGVQIIYR